MALSRGPVQAKESSPSLEQLLKQKKRFIGIMCLIFLTIYFLLPILIVLFPDWLNQPLYGSITIVWAYAISQCLLTLLLASLYIWKARQYDRLVQQIVEQTEKEGVT